MHKLLAIVLLIGLTYSCTTLVQSDAAIPTVSYQKDIAPIILANCGQSNCHGSDNTRRFNLLSYSELSRLVVPNQPHNSRLYNVIRLYDDNAMPPKSYDPLSDTQIGQIYIWILQGATEN